MVDTLLVRKLIQEINEHYCLANFLRFCNVLTLNVTGIDTSKALLEEIRKDERKNENQSFLLEPLLALTGSLTLMQTDAVSGLHKCDVPTQLYLTSKLGIPEAIL